MERVVQTSYRNIRSLFHHSFIHYIESTSTTPSNHTFHPDDHSVRVMMSRWRTGEVGGMNDLFPHQVSRPQLISSRLGSHGVKRDAFLCAIGLQSGDQSSPDTDHEVRLEYCVEVKTWVNGSRRSSFGLCSFVGTMSLSSPYPSLIPLK